MKQVRDKDQHCIECGYPIRGLRTNGNCPECGIQVSLSLRGDQPEYSSIKWLNSVRRGIYLTLAVLPASVLGLICLSMIGVGPKAAILRSLFGFATQGLLLVGTLYVSNPEPRCAYSEGPFALRRAIRVGALLAFPGIFFHVSPVNTLSDRSATLALSGFYLLGMGAALCEALYLCRLARRGGNRNVEMWFTTFIWVGVAYMMCTIGAFLTAVLVEIGPSTTRHIANVILTVRPVVVVACVLFFVGGLVACVRYLNRSLRKARAGGIVHA